MNFRVGAFLRQAFGDRDNGHHGGGRGNLNLNLRGIFNAFGMNGSQRYQRYHQPSYSSEYAEEHNLPHPNLQRGGYRQQPQVESRGAYVDNVSAVDAYQQHKSKGEANVGGRDDDLAAAYEGIVELNRKTDRFKIADRLYHYADNCPANHPNAAVIADALRSTNLDGERLKAYDSVIAQAQGLQEQEASAYIRQNLLALNSQWGEEDGRGQPTAQAQSGVTAKNDSFIQNLTNSNPDLVRNLREVFDDKLVDGKSNDKSAIVTLVAEMKKLGVEIDSETAQKLASTSEKSYIKKADVLALTDATGKFIGEGFQGKAAMAAALKQAANSLHDDKLSVTSIKPTSVPVAMVTAEDKDNSRTA